MVSALVPPVLRNIGDGVLNICQSKIFGQKPLDREKVRLMVASALHIACSIPLMMIFAQTSTLVLASIMKKFVVKDLGAKFAIAILVNHALMSINKSLFGATATLTNGYYSIKHANAWLNIPAKMLSPSIKYAFVALSGLNAFNSFYDAYPVANLNAYCGLGAPLDRWFIQPLTNFLVR